MTRKQDVGKISIALLLVFTILLGTVAGPVSGAAADDLDFSDDGRAPDFQIDDDLTVAAHEGEWGYTDADMRFYSDDQGDKTLGKFVVNTTFDEETGDNANPYSFTVTDVEDDSFGAFPRRGDDEDDDDTDAGPAEDNLASALDSSEWTKSGADSSTLTLSDTTTASNVDAFKIATNDSWTSGSTATAQYANWTSELDSDESKRVLMLAVDVDTLDSGTTVEINVTDESGDEKVVYIDSSKNYADDDVLANATGEGYVLQVKLSDLTTNGGGSWDNIESIDVTVSGGDFTGSFAWIDLEKKGIVELGEKRVEDDDGDYTEMEDINSSFKGDINVHSMTTLPAEWDDAVIHDVSYPVKWLASLLIEEGEDAEYVVHSDDASDYAGYERVANISFRLEVPDAIDLSHSNLELRLDQRWPSERYIDFQYDEGAGDDDFGDISYTDKSDVLETSPGDDEIDVDTTVSAGTAYAINVRLKLTQSEYDALTGASSSGDEGGAGTGPTSQSGGFVDWIVGVPGAVIAIVTAAFGRLKGWI